MKSILLASYAQTNLKKAAMFEIEPDLLDKISGSGDFSCPKPSGEVTTIVNCDGTWTMKMDY